MSGSLVPPDFGGRHGTAAPLILQTCMNEQPKTKHFRGDSKPDGGGQLRTVVRGNKTSVRARRRSAEPNSPLAATGSRFHPARALLISLGWLRLFQAIVSDGIPSARRPSSS